MWTSICVLERRAKRNSTICSLVCSKTTARRLPGWVRPVPTGHDNSLRQPRSEGFLFTIRCGEYSIFTILSQEVKPGWDSSPNLFGPKQSKNVAEAQQELFVSHKWRLFVRVGGRCDELVSYCKTRHRQASISVQPASEPADWWGERSRPSEQRLCNWVNMEISSHGDSTVTEQPVRLSHGCPLNNYWNFVLLKREGSVWGIQANVHNYFHISHFVLFIKTDLKGNSTPMNENRVTTSQPPANRKSGEVC